MKIFKKLYNLAAKYPASFLGFTATAGYEIVGLDYLVTSISHKDPSEALIGGAFVLGGIVVGKISKDIRKKEKGYIEDISSEIETQGFTKRLIRHVDANLLKTIASERGLEKELKTALELYPS